MAACLVLYSFATCRELALLIMVKLYAEHGEQEIQRALKQFNQEWDDD